MGAPRSSIISGNKPASEAWIPEDKALASFALDCARMLEDGLLFGDAEPFAKFA